MKIAVTTIAFSANDFLVNLINKSFSSVKYNEKGKRLNSEELIQFLSDAEVAIIGLDEIDTEILKKLPNLKCIVKFGVGLNNIDLEACKNRNIIIGWEGGVNRMAVAEITLGFMISLSRNIFSSSNKMSRGIWKKNGGKSLSELTIGIIGLGNIGKEIAKLLKPFGAKILAFDIIDYTEYCVLNNIQFVSKLCLFQHSDIITIHTPLDHSTINLIDKPAFNLMNKKPYIINTARGGIIDENALIEAVNSKKIKGAALDVYKNEPLLNESIYQSEKIICTPHISGNSYDAVIKMGISSINFVKKYYFERHKKI